MTISPTTDQVAILRTGSAAEPDFFFSGGLSAQRSSRACRRASRAGVGRVSPDVFRHASRAAFRAEARAAARDGARLPAARSRMAAGSAVRTSPRSRSGRTRAARGRSGRRAHRGRAAAVVAPGAGRTAAATPGHANVAARALRGRGPVRGRADAPIGVRHRAAAGGGPDAAARLRPAVPPARIRWPPAAATAPPPRRKRHDRCQLARWRRRASRPRRRRENPSGHGRKATGRCPATSVGVYCGLWPYDTRSANHALYRKDFQLSGSLPKRITRARKRLEGGILWPGRPRSLPHLDEPDEPVPEDPHPRELLPSTGSTPRYGKARHRRAEDGDKTLERPSLRYSLQKRHQRQIRANSQRNFRWRTIRPWRGDWRCRRRSR